VRGSWLDRAGRSQWAPHGELRHLGRLTRHRGDGTWCPESVVAERYRSWGILISRRPALLVVSDDGRQEWQGRAGRGPTWCSPTRPHPPSGSPAGTGAPKPSPLGPGSSRHGRRARRAADVVGQPGVSEAAVCRWRRRLGGRRLDALLDEPPPGTSGSWLNMVERWLGELTTNKIRRGAHTSVGEPQAGCPRVDRAVEHRATAVGVGQDRRCDPDIARPVLRAGIGCCGTHEVSPTTSLTTSSANQQLRTLDAVLARCPSGIEQALVSATTALVEEDPELPRPAPRPIALAAVQGHCRRSVPGHRACSVPPPSAEPSTFGGRY